MTARCVVENGVGDLHERRLDWHLYSKVTRLWQRQHDSSRIVAKRKRCRAERAERDPRRSRVVVMMRMLRLASNESPIIVMMNVAEFRSRRLCKRCQHATHKQRNQHLFFKIKINNIIKSCGCNS